MVVAAAVTALVVNVLVAAAKLNAGDLLTRGVGPVWAGVMVLIAVTAHLVQLRSSSVAGTRIGVALLAGAAVAIVTVPLTVGLHGTGQPPNTILHGDMAFRTEYVTRFAATWHLDDYTFRGLEAFYPPAWFWLAGRSAHVLGITPWHIVKPFTILTIGAALGVSFLLWRTMLRPAGALSAAIGSSLVLPPQIGHLNFSTQAWYSPYSCFVAVTGIAWLAATLHAVSGPASRRRLGVLAVVGAVLALTYYLLFVILVVVLVALALLPSAVPRAARLRRVGALCGVIVVLTAIFWVPLIAALVHGGASQGQFVRPDFLTVSVGISRPLALAILAVVALTVLVLTSAAQASRAVVGLLAGAVIYQLISVTTLVFAHNQLQPHRAVTMLWATYGAAVPVAFEALQGRNTVVKLGDPALRRVVATLAVAVAVPAIFVLGSNQGADLAAGPYSVAAHEAPALGQVDAMSNFITSTSGKRPQQLLVASSKPALLVTRPYYGFLPLRARYAHPEAHLDQRIAVMRAAAACPDAACADRVLSTSRFGRLDALVLARTFGSYRLETEADNFPEPTRVTILFRRNLFPPSIWMRRDIGGYAVLVRRPAA